MRFVRPKLGSTRITSWFAILPVRIGRETRWLEVVEVKQEMTEVICLLDGEIKPDWYNKEFIN